MKTVTRSLFMEVQIDIPVVSEGLEVVVDPPLDVINELQDLVQQIADLEGVRLLVDAGDSEVKVSE